MGEAIAIVGGACRYPDASDLDRLWELVVARRRAFRPIPRGRLNLDDYSTAASGDPDRTYARYAAVLEGWEFDRSRFRVPGSVYRVTDATHWLALQVAADTLAAAGFPEGRGVDRDRVGVVVGNTLTGEFSRSGLMRLRWPYVRRVLQDVLAREGRDGDALADLLGQLEKRYKAPFPEPNDESLAGGLANTIAGRVCNHFDFHGGGYTVDGACSSSLLAVVTGCTALLAGDVDLVLAGGVDLSLDPFELVGFARTGALAGDAMRIYDADPTGFWPGEGCGMVALMRAEDAQAAGRWPLALICGWGVSSDGRGGLTRPEPAGQSLALRRAYERAGFGPETVTLFEGHGTGTAVGDHAELTTLIEVQGGRRRRAAAALGSIKANIGHTKAAAGVAGLIKATLALQRQVIPPTTGCEDPHELLRAPRAPLRVVPAPEPWPDAPLRAGVSAMGFGGVNTHIVVESPAPPRRRALSAGERRLARRPLSHELFVFGADSGAGLGAALARVAERTETMSFAEHTDLAASLTTTDTGTGTGASPGAVRPWRAAVIARDPAELGRRARQALRLLPELERAPGRERGPGFVTGPGLFLGHGRAGRVGLLFTGQGAPVPAGPGALGVVFPGARDHFGIEDRRGGSRADGVVDTATAQPAIFRASLAGLDWLSRLGIQAHAAAGHSLGEITALCWAGALTNDEALDLVIARGQLMSQTGIPGTGMASIAAPPEAVLALIADTRLVIAADNGASQVVAGPLTDIDPLLERARAEGIIAQRLKVSHAFHSRAVAAAEPALAEHLTRLKIAEVQRPVYSTISGRLLTTADDPRQMLAAQITAPVLFRQAVTDLAAGCDLLIEVGPGHGLAALARDITDIPAIALDTGAESADALCQATGALHAIGASTDLQPMFTERFHRPFDLWRHPTFLENPCEQAPEPPDLPGPVPASPEPAPTGATAQRNRHDEAGEDITTIVRRLVADAVELPVDAIDDTDRLLADLHLNSLRVTQLAAQAARACGRSLPTVPPALAGLTLADLVTAIAAIPADDAGALPAAPGVAQWHRVLIPETEPVDLLAGGPVEDAPQAWRVCGSGPLRDAVEPLLPVLPATPGGPPAELVFLPENPGDPDIAVLLDVAYAAVASGAPLTVVDHGDTASGFLATIRQEHPRQAVRWIQASSSAAAGVIAELLRTPAGEHMEIVVDSTGRAALPSYRPVRLAAPEDAAFPLAPGDVVLVTGGGKGIGFQTAVALAARGVRLALIGRADPAHDAELRGNLERLRAAGVPFRYRSADVADAASVRRAVAEMTGALGPVTALIHSSGINRPARFTDLDRAAYADHATAKSHGLRTVIDALDPGALRVVIAYGSVIGRFGLPGEAHYALANGRMRELARVLTRELPDCWVCTVDWTVWSGAGMAERLDTLDGLVGAGVVPLPVERGVELLLGLLTTRPPAASVVIAGRLPALDRTGSGTGSGTGHGYLERVLVNIPGVELVAEADLRVSGFLADHRIDGLCVLPAVCALEAMAQAARMVAGRPVAGIVNARFDRPVIIPAEGARTVRICALRRPDGDVDVVLRSDESGFATDHCAGRTTVAAAAPPDVPARRSRLPAHQGGRLYGPLFFHGPRFQRLRRYEHLETTGCTAVLSGGRLEPGLPSGSQLGDPALNDSTIHVLQACVPHRRLLPVGCGRFTVHTRAAVGDLELAAVERAHRGAEYVYDIVVRDTSGRPVVSWEGLRLRAVGPLLGIDRWPMLLLGPYLQRSITALLPQVGLDVRCGEDRAIGSPAADACPGDDVARRRGHRDGIVLSASGPVPVACDWQWITDSGGSGRPCQATPWGAQVDRLARLTGEPAAHVLARLRAVQGCLSKTGRPAHGTLTVQGVYENSWMRLRVGADDAVSVVVEIEGEPLPVALAILQKGDR